MRTIVDMTDGHILRCLNCGEFHTVAFPVSLYEYLRKCKAFNRLHKNCQSAKLEEIKK